MMYGLYKSLIEIGCDNQEAAGIMYREATYYSNESERRSEIQKHTGFSLWYCGKGSGSTGHFVWPQANDSAVTLMPAQLSNPSGHGSPGRAIRMTPVRQLQVLRASALDAQFRRVELWCARCRSKPAVRPRPREDIASHGPSACSLSLFSEGTNGAGRTGPPG
jgi:hypothetical protein